MRTNIFGKIAKLFKPLPSGGVGVGLLLPIFMQAAEPFVSFEPVADGIELRQGSISYSEQDFEGVKIAIGNLKTDMQKTIGFEAALLVGTVGKNADIDRMVKQGLLTDLKGRREKYLIATIDNQVVIAGSDRRGTIYGIYELSRQLGVSPWYW